jgi:enoyl-CoA hydratase
MSDTGIQVSVVDDIRTLFLSNGRGNALDEEFLNRISIELDAAAADPLRGLVLSAEGSTFCAGLNLVKLYDYDREQMQAVLDALYAVGRQLFLFPRPVIAALNGHAIAGGAYLSLCCDARYMAQGDGKWGLNESALGIAMPACTMEVLRYGVPRRVLEKVLYAGAIYPAFKAVDMGVLDELLEADQLQERARELALSWTTSVDAFADIKQRLKAPAAAAMEQARAGDCDWLDLWFADETRERIALVREQLLTRKKDDASNDG